MIKKIKFIFVIFILVFTTHQAVMGMVPVSDVRYSHSDDEGITSPSFLDYFLESSERVEQQFSDHLKKIKAKHSNKEEVSVGDIDYAKKLWSHLYRTYNYDMLDCFLRPFYKFYRDKNGNDRIKKLKKKYVRLLHPDHYFSSNHAYSTSNINKINELFSYANSKFSKPKRPAIDSTITDCWKFVAGIGKAVCVSFISKTFPNVFKSSTIERKISETNTNIQNKERSTRNLERLVVQKNLALQIKIQQLKCTLKIS